MTHSAQTEREAVVKWLRSNGDWPLVTYHAKKLADRIERGDHHREDGK